MRRIAPQELLVFLPAVFNLEPLFGTAQLLLMGEANEDERSITLPKDVL